MNEKLHLSNESSQQVLNHTDRQLFCSLKSFMPTLNLPKSFSSWFSWCNCLVNITQDGFTFLPILTCLLLVDILFMIACQCTNPCLGVYSSRHPLQDCMPKDKSMSGNVLGVLFKPINLAFLLSNEIPSCIRCEFSICTEFL